VFECGIQFVTPPTDRWLHAAAVQRNHQLVYDAPRLSRSRAGIGQNWHVSSVRIEKRLPLHLVCHPARRRARADRLANGPPRNETSLSASISIMEKKPDKNEAHEIPDSFDPP